MADDASQGHAKSKTDRVFRAWQGRLRDAMQQWQETQKDEGSLLRGAALSEAEEKLKERPDDLSEAERNFIHQSLQAKERQKKETARRRLEIRTAWGIAVGSLVAVAISSGLAWMAWNKTKETELSHANSLGRYSQSLLSEGKDLDAFVQAIWAGKVLQKHRTSDPGVMQALQEALNQRSEQNRFMHQNFFSSVAIASDSKTLVSGNFDGQINVWNLEKGGAPRTLTGHESYVNSVAITPDGKTLVSGSLDNSIRVWNFDLESLMERSCDWVREYLENPSSGVSEEEKRLCSGVGSPKQT